MMRFRNLLAATIILLMPVATYAASFTYDFNQTFSNFSVTGTMTTDTDSGALQTSDITGYNLVLNDGTSTVNLTPGNSQEAVINNSALTATAAGLFFNFSNDSLSLFIIESPYIGSGNDYVCFQGVYGGCDPGNNAHESVSIGNKDQQIQSEIGNVQIASAADAPVPEPESLVLLGSGLFGLVGIARRRMMQ